MKLPAGADVRLAFIPRSDQEGAAYFVFLAAPPRKAGTHLLDLVWKPGEMAVLVKHPPGRSWPDQQGEALAELALADNGVAIFEFDNMEDALACHRRVRRDMGQ